MTFSTTSSAPRWDARMWGTLVVLCGALFLDGLDISMVGVALPSIRDDLGLSTEQLQWIVSGYVLGYGGLLLLGGRAADLLGRRRVFLAALGLFAVASLLGGLADDGTVLVLTRFVKGVAAAFTVPSGLSIITTSFAEGPARNRALSIYSAVGASGFSLGLVFGGLLTTLGWRWTFLLPAPVALAFLAAGARLIRRDRTAPTARRHFDLGGAVSITAAMLVLVRTVVRAPDVGWSAGATFAGFALAALLLAAFVAIERRVAHPLVRLGILRSGTLLRANAGAFALTGCYFGFQFVVTLYLQTLLGWSALAMALALLPAGLIVAFGSPQVGRLASRVGTQRLIVVAFAAFVVGYALFLRLDASSSYAGLVLPTVLLLGLGFATGFPALNIQATAGVADAEQGLASGLVNTSLQIGGALGLAIVSAVVSSHGGAGAGSAELLDGYREAVAVAAGIALLALLVSLSGLVSRAPAAALEGADA
jgi:EmrB/QacA subfamily drug resistance transporter